MKLKILLIELFYRENIILNNILLKFIVKKNNKAFIIKHL